MILKRMKELFIYKIEFYKIMKEIEIIIFNEEWLEVKHEKRFENILKRKASNLLPRVLYFVDKYEDSKVRVRKKSELNFYKEELSMNSINDGEYHEYKEAISLIKLVVDCFKNKPVLAWLSEKEYKILLGTGIILFILLQID